MNEKKFGDLEPFHREKVFKTARQQWNENQEVIRAMIAQWRESRKVFMEPLKPVEPCGVKSFDCKRWEGGEWSWFCDRLSERLTGAR